MEYIASYIGYKTNYRINNQVNIFNAFIQILEEIENKQHVVDLIKLNIGMTFLEDMRLYLFKKKPDSNILNYLK